MESTNSRKSADGDVSLMAMLSTTLDGLKATAHEALKAEVTEQYPEQRPSLPWGVKGQLSVEILDCIGCHKCASACPCDCIRIDTVRAPIGALKDTNDGHKRMFEVVRFDIDMAKCCYCGLCTGRSSYVPADKKDDPAALAYADKTAACPTDCINFYSRYENGSESAADMVHHFSHYNIDEARERWNSASPDRRRTTHLGAPDADYSGGQEAGLT